MYSVIIADDEHWTLEKIKKLFKWADYGFELVAETESADDLVRLVDEVNPDVIFLDIKMRGRSGLDALKQIRDNGSRCKAVIISAYSQFEDAQLAIKYGAFDYCLKPVSQDSADELLQNLRLKLDDEHEVEPEKEITEIDNKAFENLVHYVRVHYREKLYLGELSKKFYINLTYCCYLFNKNMGCNFTTFLMRIRMERAAELLVTTNMTVKQIAEHLGYDYYYFNKIFKKYYNKTPSKYKQERE